MPIFRIVGGLLLFGAFMVSSSSASVLLDNPPDYPGTYDSSTSLNAPNFSVRSFSSFQLPQSSTITSIRWQGLYVSTGPFMNPPVPPSNPPAPVATGFQVMVLGSGLGMPNPADVVYNQVNIPVGAGASDVHETFLANDPNFSLGFTEPTTAAIYNYSVDLAVPMTLAGNTPYWLSVAANSPDLFGYPYWGFNSSGAADTGGPTQLCEVNNGELTFQQTWFIDDGRAFTLVGIAAVPEPGTLVVWSLLGAMAVVAGWRRRG